MDHKEAELYVRQENLNVKLHNKLQSTQAKLHAKYAELFEERGKVRNREVSHMVSWLLNVCIL